MADPIIKIEVREQGFSVDEEIRLLTDQHKNIGAIVSFSGICRNEDHRISILEIEHYPVMAQNEIERISRLAAERWQLDGVTAIHRYGKLAPGEQIVLVIAASRHRQAAFDGANYIMDFLKTRAPFWKKEHLSDGGTGEWVSAKDDDDDALAKWDQ